MKGYGYEVSTCGAKFCDAIWRLRCVKGKMADMQTDAVRRQEMLSGLSIEGDVCLGYVGGEGGGQAWGGSGEGKDVGNSEAREDIIQCIAGETAEMHLSGESGEIDGERGECDSR